MGEFFSDILEWMTMLSPLWAYLIVLAISYGENIIPPIPGDIVVVFGGYLCGLGRLDYLVVVLLSTIGGALGFMTLYVVGVRVGEAVFDPDRLTWLPKHQIYRARSWLQKWGYGVVAANRFLSGARSVISLTVGMAGMSPTKTAAFATLSAAVWTALITYAGMMVGENWRIIVVYLKTYSKFVSLILVIVVLVWSGGIFVKRRRAQKVSGNNGKK